jgi:hypothetical protein
MGGRWRRELDRVGVGREERGSGGRVRGRGEVDMRKRFGRRNRSDELRRGERRTGGAGASEEQVTYGLATEGTTTG